MSNFSELMKDFNKSINKNLRLNYFKNELLKILDKKENQENRLSKSIQDYFEDLNKTLFGIGIEKGRVGTIGEIRTWKDGKKYKKMPNGKWVRVYQQHDRSAEISIARLKGKVRNAKTVDELMNIVMSNIHRFEDENGQILPIVEELKKEVAAGKTRINAGKPSTKEQIEKITKENKLKDKFNTECKKVKASSIVIGDEIPVQDENGYHFTKVVDIIPNIHGIHIKTTEFGGGGLFFPDQEVYIKKQAEKKIIDKLNDEYDSILALDNYDEQWNKLNELRQRVEEEKNKKLRELREDPEVKELIHNTEKYFAKLNEEIEPYKTLWRKCWDKVDEVYKLTETYKENERKKAEIEAKLKAEKEAKLAKANKKIADKQSAVDDAANEYRKTATIESLENEIPVLSKSFEEKDKKRKNLESKLKWKKSIVNRTKKNKLDRWESYSADEIKEAEKFVEEHDQELKDLKKEVENLKLEYDAKTDIYMDLMEKRPYIPDDRIEKCNSVNDVNNLFNSHNDWFYNQDILPAEFKKIDLQSAKEIYKCYDRMFNRFPMMKGIVSAPQEVNRSYHNYASASGGEGMFINTQHFKNWDEVVKTYNHDVESSFHPANTNIRCIFYHEFAHLIDQNIVTSFGSYFDKIKFASDNIQSAVLNKFKGHESVWKELSQYATKNAAEFLAEGIAEAFTSETPRRFAKECLRQLYKECLLAKPLFESKHKLKGNK